MGTRPEWFWRTVTSGIIGAMGMTQSTSRAALYSECANGSSWAGSLATSVLCGSTPFLISNEGVVRAPGRIHLHPLDCIILVYFGELAHRGKDGLGSAGDWKLRSDSAVFPEVNNMRNAVHILLQSQCKSSALRPIHNHTESSFLTGMKFR